MCFDNWEGIQLRRGQIVLNFYLNINFSLFKTHLHHPHNNNNNNIRHTYYVTHK